MKVLVDTCVWSLALRRYCVEENTTEAARQKALQDAETQRIEKERIQAQVSCQLGKISFETYLTEFNKLPASAASDQLIADLRTAETHIQNKW